MASGGVKFESSSAPANKFESMKKAITDFLYEKNSFTYVFELAEKYTKVSRVYLFLGILGALSLYLVIGYGSGLVVNLLGFLYPAYKSCKAIDSVDKDDDTQWLTYWVVYAAFGIIEYFTDLFLSWFPFYFLAKCAFLVWCMLPMANNGSMVIYHRLIKPFVKKHEKTFDDVIDVAKDAGKKLGQRATAAARDAAGNISLQDVQKAQEMFSDKTEKQD